MYRTFEIIFVRVVKNLKSLVYFAFIVVHMVTLYLLYSDFIFTLYQSALD